MYNSGSGVSARSRLLNSGVERPAKRGGRRFELLTCLDSSVAERHLGKMEVEGPIPSLGSEKDERPAKRGGRGSDSLSRLRKR